MRRIAAKRVLASWLALATAILGPGLSAQSVHEAPAAAPSRGAVAPKDEPGQPLHVSGVVVGPDGSPLKAPRSTSTRQTRRATTA